MTAEVEHVAPSNGRDHQHPTTQAIDQTHNESTGECSPPTIVTVRMVVDGKEVGSIIGKKGDNVKRYRDTSGAKINISDASCAERIVTLTGMLEQIRVAFNLMCIKFEDDLRANTSPGSTLPPVNVRLVIPASQCGSLIGKGGTKIKELRETTGACVQVATDMLPGSTERVVTITGGATSISNCVTEVCSIMLESPPKGATIPYRPKPPQQPMMYGMTAYGIPGQVPGMPGQAPVMAGQAPVLPGQPGMAMPPHMASTMTTPASAHPQMNASEATNLFGATKTSVIFSQSGVTFPPQPTINGLGGQQALMSPIAQQGSPLIMNPSVGNPYVLMQQGLGVPAMNAMNSYLGGPAARPFNNNIFGAVPGPQQNQSSEMVIPNELIGCIIGRGGAKINEIRKLSGAQIKISNCEEGSNDRKVTITGFPDTLSLATYLINTRLHAEAGVLAIPTPCPTPYN
ncbi:poly(rC)-binding protein 2-like isoform X3 [Watersipora subatra]|uniref:poly(rC)-binding protein 2-like isoform X3 n=1 Tax=Watersipora subatra TaxID=2589382 RepID=UPI00355B707B